MNFRVGQILYVVLRKEASVYPMQVIEEITKKTLDGEVTTYMVRAGAGNDKNKTLSINDIDGEIFDSPEKAERTLIERVSSTITARVNNAINKAKEWYPTADQSTDLDSLKVIKKSPDSNKQSPVRPEIAALAAEFAEEANASIVELPDGGTAKVRSLKLPKQLQG